ncbi:MAG: hypothetical protein PHW18_00780 [Sulfuricurvum sp.]|uniref:hypothetical protein n=1 Tax=Sulfuricurvum sp. TaxID=2025608 RepID=UPI00260502B9|nr:hypothetical protein [Sulfuricurvum sp.]MDD2828087.1 hypothetical protein [Sulfuricurvum sp.]MDD4948039.1 hypothetical protein [Sulfuricurvum sp.]
MQHYTPTDDQIRSQFVTSLMNYFKIDEDVFLRSHIDELIRPIPIARYSEFLRRLSTRDLAFKTGIEKISLIAQEMFEEQRSPLEHQAHERSQKLYQLMYDLRRHVSEEKNSEHSALERFENIRFTSIKQADSTEALLDSLDIDVVRILTKRWIYDYVSNDRGLFELRCAQEYLKALIERQRLSTQPTISNTTKKVLKNR